MLVYQLDTWYCNLGDNVGDKKTRMQQVFGGPLFVHRETLTMGGGSWCLNIAAFPLGVDDFFCWGVNLHPWNFEHRYPKLWFLMLKGISFQI